MGDFVCPFGEGRVSSSQVMKIQIFELSLHRFGDGCYLAEDPEKIDQYTTPDAPGRPGLSRNVADLHATLFSDKSTNCTTITKHTEELFYCFVVRSCRGHFASTTDGRTIESGPDAGMPIFMSDPYHGQNRRELTNIPGLKTPCVGQQPI